MNDHEMNIAIAEACGFEVWLSSLQSGLDIVKDGKRYPLPHYTTDLNAMHEAEKVLHDAQYVQFGLHLNEAWLCDNPQPMRRIGIMRAASATARQRAEAFLRTLGKWKD